MSPITHLLTGWLAANGSPTLDRQERVVITLASLAPDLDGIGIVAEFLTAGSDHPLLWYSAYHHVLCHNLAFGLLLAFIGWITATRKWLTASLALLSFHIHLAADLIGSRSPDGYQWPIWYLFPFSSACTITWSLQWKLNAWPNYVITAAALFAVLALARKRGYSPVAIFSARADQSLVEALRRRWPLCTASPTRGSLSHPSPTRPGRCGRPQN